MSLIRVGSLETFVGVHTEHRDDEVGARHGSVSSPVAGASERARKLTFNPLPEAWDAAVAGEATQDQPVDAFEVPKWKRILQIVVTVAYCLLAAGVVFGFAAIKPVLKQEGAYQDVCDGRAVCVEMRLNLMFATAAVVTNVAALPTGAILDHYGPRVCSCLGAFFLAAGAAVLAFASSVPFDGLLVGYVLLALGGPFVYISAFHLSNAFPQRSGLILALLSGAFDSSSALFLVYRIVYQKTAGSFGHREFFLVYLAVPAGIIIAQLTLLPAHSYKTAGEMMQEVRVNQEPVSRNPLGSTGPDDSAAADQVDEHTALLRRGTQEHRRHVAHEIEHLVGADAQPDKQAQREESKNDRSGVWGVLHGAPRAWDQIATPWFWLICAFTVVQMTRINYFVATVRAQYEFLLGSAGRAAALNDFFDAALPAGGLLAIPFIGLVLDRFSTVSVLAALVAAATAIGVLGLLPGERNAWAAYANVVLFVLYRPFYYTAVGDYVAKVFGFRTFGTVYGAVICLAGLGNFSQGPLDYLLHEACGGDPGPVNLGLLGLGLLVGGALVVYVGWQARRLRAEKAGWAVRGE